MVNVTPKTLINTAIISKTDIDAAYVKEKGMIPLFGKIAQNSTFNQTLN